MSATMQSKYSALHLVQVLQVAGVGAGAQYHPDATLGVPPGAGHEAARRVVQDSADLALVVVSRPGQGGASPRCRHRPASATPASAARPRPLPPRPSI